MGTTAEKLTHLSQTKSDIRDAIEAKGVSVPVETTFRDYATKVSDIKTDFSDTFNYAERVSQDGGSVENLAEVANLDFNDGATLNFIPSGKKAGKSYSQLPTDGSGDWTVDRNCEATYIDKDGVRQTAQPNEPRYDWSSGSPVLLRERQSTNLVQYSEATSSAINYFDGIGIPPTIETTIKSPTGANCFRVTSDPNAQYNFVGRDNIQPTSEVNRVKSLYARTISGTGTAMLLGHNSNSRYIVNLTEEWQFFQFITQNEIGNNNFYLSDFRGEGTLTEFLIALPQLEEGYTATSYIKTEGATVTRLADIIETTPPTGTTQIIETIDGVEQAPITNIPSTYQIPEGNINQIKMI